jgi:hypothetical protein
MKVNAISSADDVKTLLAACQQQGYLTFIYHHADPKHLLLQDKFMYVNDDEELNEKLLLLKLDITAKDLIRL